MGCYGPITVALVAHGIGADHRKGLPVGHSLGAADSRGNCTEHHLLSSLRGGVRAQMSGNTLDVIGSNIWGQVVGVPNEVFNCFHTGISELWRSFWSQGLFYPFFLEEKRGNCHMFALEVRSDSSIISVKNLSASGTLLNGAPLSNATLQDGDWLFAS